MTGQLGAWRLPRRHLQGAASAPAATCFFSAEAAIATAAGGRQGAISAPCFIARCRSTHRQDELLQVKGFARLAAPRRRRGQRIEQRGDRRPSARGRWPRTGVRPRALREFRVSPWLLYGEATGCFRGWPAARRQAGEDRRSPRGLWIASSPSGLATAGAVSACATVARTVLPLVLEIDRRIRRIALRPRRWQSRHPSPSASSLRHRLLVISSCST